MKIRKKIKDSQILWHVLLVLMVVITLFPIVFAICKQSMKNIWKKT